MPSRVRQNSLANFSDWLRFYWPSLLVVLAFFGFISKSLFQYPVAVMALIGVIYCIRYPAQLWQDRSIRLFSILFLCLWLPMLLSFIDAYNPARAAKTVFPYLRFLFAGIFIIKALGSNEKRQQLVVSSLAFMVSFWTIDAGIQHLLGKDLFGFPAIPGHMTGMFYPELHLPHVCSVLSPFLFLYIYKKQQQSWWPYLLLLPLFLVILLAGRRSTWLMLALSSIGFFIYVFVNTKQRQRLFKLTALFSFIIGAILAATILFHEPTNARFYTTLGLFSLDYEQADLATSKRLPLWETALNMIRDNPLNGIGPRGFRYAYPDYAAPDNYWESQTHPHLLLLEVLVETGLIGLVGYVLFFVFLLYGFKRGESMVPLFPFLLPVLVALFPLNAHMAFYGSLWSSMAMLLLSLYTAKHRLLTGATTP